MDVKQTQSAGAKLGADDALRLAKEASTIIVAKGKKVTKFDMKEKPTNEELLTHMLGPTGNLRAPTIKAGRTLLIGFNEDVYQILL